MRHEENAGNDCAGEVGVYYYHWWIWRITTAWWLQEMSINQQARAGRVAPSNPNPRWPAGYLEVLEELGVAERRRCFYAHWVRQFFNGHQGKRRRRDLGQNDIEAFLETLISDPSVADWQVAQARGLL